MEINIPDLKNVDIIDVCWYNIYTLALKNTI